MTKRFLILTLDLALTVMAALVAAIHPVRLRAEKTPLLADARAMGGPVKPGMTESWLHATLLGTRVIARRVIRERAPAASS